MENIKKYMEIDSIFFVKLYAASFSLRLYGSNLAPFMEMQTIFPNLYLALFYDSNIQPL